MLSDINVPGWMCSVGLNDLQACLTSTTCCTNPVHAAVIRITVQLQLHNQAAKQSGIYVHACSRVLMRSDTSMGLVPGCVGNSMLHKPCAARQHNNTKPGDGSKQVQLYSPSCTTIWHRCVCLFRWVGPIKQMLQAVPGCDGMLHKPVHTAVFRTAQTAAADQFEL
jgi:hypothetical protein